jgi:hypothetical protein
MSTLKSLTTEHAMRLVLFAVAFSSSAKVLLVVVELLLLV